MKLVRHSLKGYQAAVHVKIPEASVPPLRSKAQAVETDATSGALCPGSELNHKSVPATWEGA